mmetsp:Transcript_20467/g.26961  ORF Transcript_20467/g.26961 Transcript_20467/m.26961 type:complete len:322 (-) Transcript_20467:148-1113(-)
MIQKIINITTLLLCHSCLFNKRMVQAFHIPTTATTTCSSSFGTIMAHSKIMSRRSNNDATLLSMSSSNDNNKNSEDDDREEYNDFESLYPQSNDDGSNSQSDDLAQQFYQQLRKREEEQTKNNPSSSSPQQKQQPPKTLSEEELRKRNRKAFLKRKEISVSRQKSDDDDDDATTKNTDGGGPSPSVEAIRFFSASKGVTGRGNSLFSEPSSSSSPPTGSVKERMMQQEFNLVSVASSERTLIIQIIFVLALLVFELSIGFNGGITDGSDRFGDVPNDYNGEGYYNQENSVLQKQMEEEEIVDILKNMKPPTVTNDGASVWL